MRKFLVDCNFGSQTQSFAIYIGEPEPSHHPLHFQSEWLGKNRGGTIPPNVMDSLEKLHKLSIENNISFETLCMEALENQPKKENKEKA